MYKSLLSYPSTDKTISNWYMLGKCLWKLFGHYQFSSASYKVSYKLPIDAFLKAIENVPEKRDNRHPDKEPILEPHYKIVTIAYKLVRRHCISVSN